MAGVLTYPNFVAQVLTLPYGTRLLPPHYLQSTTNTPGTTNFDGNQPPQGTLRFPTSDFVLYWLHNYWAAPALAPFQPGTFARNNVGLNQRPGHDETCLVMLEADVIRAHVQSAVCYVSQLAAQWARTLGFYLLSRAEVTSNNSRVDLVWYAAHQTQVPDPNNWLWPPPGGQAAGANFWKPILVLEYKRPNVIRPGGAWDLNQTTGFHHDIPPDNVNNLTGYQDWFSWKQWKRVGGAIGAMPPAALQLLTPVLAVQNATNAGNERWSDGNAASLAKQAWQYQQEFRPGRVLMYDSLNMVMFDYTRQSPAGLNLTDNVMGFAWMDVTDDNNPNMPTFSMVLYASIVAGLVENYF